MHQCCFLAPVDLSVHVSEGLLRRQFQIPGEGVWCSLCSNHFLTEKKNMFCTHFIKTCLISSIFFRHGSHSKVDN